jgi:hypothetical protein
MQEYGLGYKIRLVAVVLGLVYGIGSAFVQPDLPDHLPLTPLGWYWVLVWIGTTVFMVVGLLGVIGFQQFNPFQTTPWQPPHIDSLPSFYDFPHVFHMFAFHVIPVGMGRFLTIGILFFEFDPWSVNVILNGCGVLVATWLCPHVFPRLYEESDGEEEEMDDGTKKEISAWKYTLLHVSFMASNLLYIVVPLLILYGDEPVEVPEIQGVLVIGTLAGGAIVLTMLYLLRRFLFQPPAFLGSGVRDHYATLYLAGLFVQGILFDMVSVVGVILCILLNSIFYLIPFVLLSLLLFLMHWPSTRDFHQKQRALTEPG